MKTAVIYARVSSSNDRQDTSRQIEDLKKYAISQDIEIVNIFQEHISGAKKDVYKRQGSEHLPYKQRVGGSNPSTPTTGNQIVTLLAI